MYARFIFENSIAVKDNKNNNNDNIAGRFQWLGEKYYKIPCRKCLPSDIIIISLYLFLNISNIYIYIYIYIYTCMHKSILYVQYQNNERIIIYTYIHTCIHITYLCRYVVSFTYT
jgi:hypothetical protein